jgi:hypothetical protein
MTLNKEELMRMATTEVEELLNIIGDLGYTGYKISMCKLSGYSYQQCANKFRISKQTARRLYAKCVENRYDIALKKIFQIK